MSFSSDAKEEICRLRPENTDSAVAESCGVLLYCHTFSPELIRIITLNEGFAARLPRLFSKAFELTFDQIPPEGTKRKRSLVLSDREKIARIYRTFGLDAENTVALHVNFALLEEDACRIAFVRGAFLAGGSVTDPEKRYHLELSTSHRSVAGETVSVLQELGFNPGISRRGGTPLLYLKQSDVIADFLTAIGAPVTAMNVMTARVEKEMRNTVTRQINCDSANADKTVAAAQEQIAAIRKLSARIGLDALPEPLKDAALLRITTPAASLAALASLSVPPVTKSCLNHRLKKIVNLAKEEQG